MSDSSKTISYNKVEILDLDSMNNCLKTVGFEMKWKPKVLKKLYVDDSDYNGLFFWYNEILEQICQKANNN